MNRVAVARRKDFHQKLIEQGFRSGTAIVLEQSPHLTYNSAGETARRMLKDIETRPEFAEERAKIADLEELDQIATGFVRDEAKPDQTRLKAMELQYRRKGALIDKSQVETKDVRAEQEEIDRKAAELAIKLIRESVEVAKV